MRTNAMVTTIANGLFADAKQGIDTLAEARKTTVSGLSGLSHEALMETVAGLVKGIQVNVNAPRVNEVGYPAYIGKTLFIDGDNSKVEISVRSKQNAPYKYRKDEVVQIDANIIKNIGEVYLDALTEMLYIELAIENVAALNEKLATLVEESGVGYTVSFAVDTSDDGAVVSIDDDGIVFRADIAKALEIGDMGIMNDSTEYERIIATNAAQDFVNALSVAQTPVQLIRSKNGLTNVVASVPTRKREDKILRQTYHRNSQYLHQLKAGIGYFSEEVEVGGNKVHVFALVQKAEDGELSLVLKPFNIEDATVVDYDVLAHVQQSA